MVFAPGGYKPSDFLRLGIPVALVVGIATLIAVPLCGPSRLSSQCAP